MGEEVLAACSVPVVELRVAEHLSEPLNIAPLRGQRTPDETRHCHVHEEPRLQRRHDIRVDSETRHTPELTMTTSRHTVNRYLTGRQGRRTY